MKGFSFEIRCLVLLVLSSLSLIVNAQKSEADVFVTNYAQGDGIALRWFDQNIYFPEGVTIYRRSTGSDWQKLNSSPLLYNAEVPSSIVLSEKAGKFFNLYSKQSHAKFTETFAGVLTLVESVKEFNLALAINVAYVDKSAQLGENYEYKIEAVLDGKTIVVGTTPMIKCKAFEPIDAPEELRVVRKKKKLEVYWKKDEAKHFDYSVYLKRGENEWKLVDQPVASSALPDNKKPYLTLTSSADTTYTVKLCARDYFGEQSEFTKDIILDVQDFTPPTEPVPTIDVDSKKMAVIVSWSANVDEDLSHYNVYRAIDPEEFTTTPINKYKIPASEISYTDYPEYAGSYYYKVEAVDFAGNATKSMYLNGTVHDIRPPAAPQNLTVRVDTGLLILSWDDNTEADLRGYRVYRSVADADNVDNDYVVAHRGVLEMNYYEEEMPENVRNPFALVIRAVDTSLNVSEMSNIVIGQLPDVIPPVAPFIKKSYEKDNSLVIEWMPNVDSDLAAYNIYKRTKGDTTAFEKLNYTPIPPYLNTYKDREIDRGQYYEYYIEALDMGGLVSDASNSINGRLEYLPLSGHIIIDKYKINARNELSLRWSLDSLVNEAIIGSSIHKSLNGKRAMQVGGVSTKTELKDKIKESGNYEYYIRAYGDRGNVVSSDTVKIKIEIDK